MAQVAQLYLRSTTTHGPHIITSPCRAQKIAKLKLWEDEYGSPWRRNVVECGFGILVVSQFTLYAITDKGAKPDFHLAMRAEGARQLFDAFVDQLRGLHPGGAVQTGAFGQLMQVDIVNHGPVTILLDTRDRQAD